MKGELPRPTEFVLHPGFTLDPFVRPPRLRDVGLWAALLGGLQRAMLRLRPSRRRTTKEMAWRVRCCC
jgi:hypothetical protein